MNYEAAWLRYDAVNNQNNKKYFARIYVDKTCNLNKPGVIKSAVEEIQIAAKGLYGVKVEATEKEDTATLKLLLTREAVEQKVVNQNLLGSEGYRLTEKTGCLRVESNTETGLLYGTFAFLRKIAMGENLEGMEETSIPDKEFRMLNHWDNTDGSIERGYSGQSFFFEKGQIIINERTRDYARLLASVGINATVINNVNVKAEATYFITEDYLPKVAEMSELFAEYGVKLYLSLNYAACMDIGGLDNADPFDQNVIAWWQDRMKLVYKYAPKLGGFLIKADSEGRPGPFTYGRNQAEGANMLADAIAPLGGTIIWRCFVYNCQQDWRDTKTDRARAAYDYFYDLDGNFHDNVILQIKNGPIDFQVREPIMPLFGKLVHTKHIMEVQIAQEYTGQQVDLCYLIPWFKEILNTHTGCGAVNDTLGDILHGSLDIRKNQAINSDVRKEMSDKSDSNITMCACEKASQQIPCNGMGMGIAAVVNTGNDANWTGHDLATANLYGFGRLAWSDALTAEEIAAEWAKQTFTKKADTVQTITGILMKSWSTYEKYVAPLGVGFMVNPGVHYGPNVDGYEYSRWGTYHRADCKGIGVDRSEQGTGYAKLYAPLLGDVYNDVNKCPDNLLLFFHHVPYTHVLQSGENVLQHIYNTHFEGVEEVEQMIEKWNGLKSDIDEMRFERVVERMQRQLYNAKEWRDQINTYFYRKTGIADEKGRKIYE